jgi:hypothetical protein
VRQPIYKSALELWRNYEPFLHEQKASLSDEIAAYPARFLGLFDHTAAGEIRRQDDLFGRRPENTRFKVRNPSQTRPEVGPRCDISQREIRPISVT